MWTSLHALHNSVFCFELYPVRIVFSVLRSPKILSGPEEGRNGVQMLVEGQLVAGEGKEYRVREMIYATEAQLRGKSLERKEIQLEDFLLETGGQGEHGGVTWGC